MALIRTGGASSSTNEISHQRTSMNGRVTPANVNFTGNYSDIYIYAYVATESFVGATVNGESAGSFVGTNPAIAHVTGNFTDPAIVVTGTSDFGSATVIVDAV